jgi:superfamily I DNA/RNA helicase
MAFTDQQHAFVSAVKNNPRQSYILQALAGTGKTTTLLAACPDDEPTLAMAFNKKIQTELDSKFPANADCMTFNGLGHRTWAKYLNRRPAVNQSKLYHLTRAVCEEIDERRVWKSMSDIMQLVTAAKNIGLVHSQIVRRYMTAPLVQDDPEVWYEMCDNADTPEFCIEPARKVLLASTEAALRADIDFADQLYMPVVFRAPFPKGKYNHIIVDEAQDLGPLEHAIISLCLSKKARLIAAGDHHQAIYGWRGAHSDSMLRLQNQTDAIELPLTITWRCPKLVVKEANAIVPEYEAAPEAPDGNVERWGYDWSITDLKVNNQSVILCRNNKPLFILAMKMIQQKVPCRMEGRDIGKNIKKIVRNLTNEDDEMSSKDLIGLTDQWMQEQREKYLKKGDFPKAAKVEDQGESIIAVAMACSTVEEVIGIIDDLFGKDSRGITLSTIHKAKGLEWQNVYLLNADLIGQKAKAEWAQQQEQNLRYVAITRAMQSLTYMEMD